MKPLLCHHFHPVPGFFTREMFDLVAATEAAGNDLRIGARFFHGGKENLFSNLLRQGVVLFLITK